MKPSELCKQAGLSSLKELSEITGVHEQTLTRWAKQKPKLFEIIIVGATHMPEQNDDVLVIYCQPNERGRKNQS